MPAQGQCDPNVCPIFRVRLLGQLSALSGPIAAPIRLPPRSVGRESARIRALIERSAGLAVLGRISGNIAGAGAAGPRGPQPPTAASDRGPPPAHAQATL